MTMGLRLYSVVLTSEEIRDFFVILHVETGFTVWSVHLTEVKISH